MPYVDFREGDSLNHMKSGKKKKPETFHVQNKMESCLPEIVADYDYRPLVITRINKAVTLSFLARLCSDFHLFSVVGLL